MARPKRGGDGTANWHAERLEFTGETTPSTRHTPMKKVANFPPCSSTGILRMLVGTFRAETLLVAIMKRPRIGSRSRQRSISGLSNCSQTSSQKIYLFFTKSMKVSVKSSQAESIACVTSLQSRCAKYGKRFEDSPRPAGWCRWSPFREAGRRHGWFSWVSSRAGICQISAQGTAEC